MSAVSIAWDIPLPLTAFGVVAGLAALVLAIGIVRRAPGLAWRGLAVAALLVAIGDPVLVVEDRSPLIDIAVILVDETASQQIGERAQRTRAAVAELLG